MSVSAKILIASIYDGGSEIITFELEYPRIVHSEFMTHRVFSRNAASSRAIPVKKQLALIMENIAYPSEWGGNQPGMVSSGEIDTFVLNVLEVGSEQPWASIAPDVAWEIAAANAAHVAECFATAGYHKQVANRLLEPFAHIKVVVTATEWDNFFHLRMDENADPTIRELAQAMYEAYVNRVTVEIEDGEWHVPYYENGIWTPYEEGEDGILRDINGNSADQAIAISASCCAQVSYRLLDASLGKAEDIYRRLVEAEPVHASPFEHQATPISAYYVDQNGYPIVPPEEWQEGVTHMDREGTLWSGNFRGWIQNRQLVPNNVCKKYAGPIA